MYEGQKVVTSHGNVAVVAMIADGKTFVYDRRGMPQAAVVRHDALGGEHDQSLGLPYGWS